MKYLTTTFSPSMLGKDRRAFIEEISLDEVPHGLVSAVGHEVTAQVLSALLGQEVSFNRVNLTLNKGDEVYAVIPNFRPGESREFSADEVRSAGYRVFHCCVE